MYFTTINEHYKRYEIDKTLTKKYQPLNSVGQHVKIKHLIMYPMYNDYCN